MMTVHKKVQLPAKMFIQSFFLGTWFIITVIYLAKAFQFSGIQIGLDYGITVFISLVISFIIIGLFPFFKDDDCRFII